MAELTHAANRQTAVIRDMRAELEARDVQLESLQAEVTAATPSRVWAGDATALPPIAASSETATPQTVLLPPSPPRDDPSPLLQSPLPCTPGVFPQQPDGHAPSPSAPSDISSDDDGAAARALARSSRAAQLLSSVLDSSPPSLAATALSRDPALPTVDQGSVSVVCQPSASPLLHPTVSARLKAMCLESDGLREERDRFARLWAGAAAAQQAWQARCLASEGAADELRQAELLLTRRVGELEASMRDRERQVEELRGWLGARGRLGSVPGCAEQAADASLALVVAGGGGGPGRVPEGGAAEAAAEEALQVHLLCEGVKIKGLCLCGVVRSCMGCCHTAMYFCVEHIG